MTDQELRVLIPDHVIIEEPIIEPGTGKIIRPRLRITIKGTPIVVDTGFVDYDQFEAAQSEARTQAYEQYKQRQT